MTDLLVAAERTASMAAAAAMNWMEAQEETGSTAAPASPEP